MVEPSQYAKGVISLQIGVSYRGRECTVLVVDPKRPQGYSWVGGHFFPGGDLVRVAESIAAMEAGIPLEAGSTKLREIVYSQTAMRGNWIGNHCFSARAQLVHMWSEPQDGDLGIALAATDSLGSTPEIVKTIRQSKVEQEFAWSINDGAHIARTAYREFLSSQRGSQHLQQIPIMHVPLPHESKLSFGHAINIANLLVPHTYKGKQGYVCIINRDSDKPALIGGKVESLIDRRSRNIDPVSCVLAESEEEIGLQLMAMAIIGCAMTPLDIIIPDYRQKGHENSFLTTSFLARPINPHQLDDVLDAPKKFIREPDKIKDVFFVPHEDFVALIERGKMRTPDMVQFGRQYLYGSPAQRPSLESIAVLPQFGKLSDDGGLPETRTFSPEAREYVRGVQRPRND